MNPPFRKRSEARPAMNRPALNKITNNKDRYE
jgi:hypothetical protein